MSKNDERILILKKQIEDKKKDLLESKIKFTPETNCILDFEGNNYNLNVCSEEMLYTLMIRLNMYIMSANDLGIDLSLVTLNNYSINMWISDIKNKIAVVKLKKEETELKKMESKLDKLLSEDKKTELELDEIASSLGL